MRSVAISTQTELAKARNQRAAERTLLAWMQNCLALMLFGLALEPLLGATVLNVAAPQGLNQPFRASAPSLSWHLFPTVERELSLAFIATGVLLLLIAMGQYRLTMAALAGTSPPLSRVQWLNRLTIVVIIILGVCVLAAVLLLSAMALWAGL
ncbi:YidH family protein [Leptolyngbya sp. PCC 6406]|uniref:YidH family protein n=1 Tax=Leptolyngbya sp. PCC 6406 TaxID=1173264 RepID=UPI0002AC0A38|nr:DUF202 domain-containing protein [Leptolyngbya sp. PCC 6406]